MDVDAVSRDGRGDGGEAMHRPPPPRVRGTRVDHQVRPTCGKQAAGGGALIRPHAERRFQHHRCGTGQAGHFQPPQNLRLVEAVRQRALQWRGVARRGTDGVSGAQAQQERVGVASAAVRLYG